MPLSQNLSAIFGEIATDTKTLRLAVGLLADLDTDAKDSLVEAINELKASLETNTSLIDNGVSSDSKTFSSNEIVTRLSDLKQSILGGTPQAAFDTLVELANYAATDQTAMSTLVTVVGATVRFDQVQTLTTAEKTQARSNIGAYGADEIGNPNTDFLAAYIAAKA